MAHGSLGGAPQQFKKLPLIGGLDGEDVDQRDELAARRDRCAGCARACGTHQASSVASSEISAFSTLETGQPAFAFAASAWNVARSAPGTFAVKVKCTVVIAYPPSTWASVTSAVVSILSAVGPASIRNSESAIVKQPACAAPCSSSGFVPGVPSKRLA